ncbi:MAG: DNA-protecting protein DprA [Candidatus Ryanbacteria bacterium CG10_big_fil_rev_8_21_14_0_10_43_42]|uniref:DNA-protecting protein DprA n=1 Tax=Candidatus Ryanbacteria bacterium CG10_big_fil_rev_8_21_14_0_10_43_42 TaxID=1974864 RepID=A0A2M8KXX1_9BACT|nr:MAG: DNA-protecting protein DprA [Candidatus Ryanbacteria bacterium CG10_big_fil_rev_8_21_14_0_10_43_42]
MDTETLFAHALNTIPELGPLRMRSLKNYCGSFTEAWHSPRIRIEEALENKKIAHSVCQKRKNISPEHLWKDITSSDITVLLPDSSLYPRRLHTIPAPPQILYLKGILPAEDTPAIAVVGTRHPTQYGKDMCDNIVRDLSHAGICIVSGLAIGIDARTHMASLDASGHTIAVVGSGLHQNVLYPASNRKLADAILSSGGAIISEYPPSLRAATWTFPQRNRIIAGISDATLVIEARKQSGTRITANYALEYGRDIFAVPGPVYSLYSETPHMLIKEGAGLVTSADDILSTLPGYTPPISTTSSVDTLSSEEHLMLSLLSEPRTINDLVHATKKSSADITRIISMLEIGGKIKNNGAGTYHNV